MSSQIYSKEDFIIFRVKRGYVLYNTLLPFKLGHTHLKSFNMCKTLIDLAINKKIPISSNTYILVSLKRISQDNIFKQKIDRIIEERERKGLKQRPVKLHHNLVR